MTTTSPLAALPSKNSPIAPARTDQAVHAVSHAPFRLVAALAANALTENRLSLVLLLLSVAAGVGFQMPNVANLAGYRGELLRQEVAAGYGHVRVRPANAERFVDARPVVEAIQRLGHVAEVEPILFMPGAVRVGKFFSLLQMDSVNPSAQRRPYQMASGDPLRPGHDEDAVLGTNLARRMGVKMGDEFELDILLSPRPRLVLDDQGVGTYTMKVRGLVGGSGIDHLFVSRDFVSREMGQEGAANILIVYANESSLPTARRIATDIETSVPEVTAHSWFDDSSLIRSSVGAIDAIGTIADFMSLFAVGVPVLALLYIDGMTRRRQVSLLAAMGFRTREIFQVFLLKALFVGVVGVLVGGLLGGGLIEYFKHHPIYNYDKFVIRPALDWSGVVRPMLLVLGATLLAGSYPAWSAARVNPSAMLRRIE